MAQQVLKEFGHLDILVNNAGVNDDKTFVKMDHAAWRKVLSINLDGVFNCTKVFVEQMIGRQYGRVVNITSVIGQIGNFGQANYAASKAGVAAFTKSLAKELAGKGITVNAIAPGFVETDMVMAIPRRCRPPAPADPARAIRPGGGGRARRRLHRLGRRRLHHRRRALHQRRTIDVAPTGPCREQRPREARPRDHGAGADRAGRERPPRDRPRPLLVRDRLPRGQHPRLADQNLLAALIGAHRLQADTVPAAEELGDLDPGRDRVARPHRLQEREVLGEVDRAGPGSRVPITAEIMPAVKMPGAIGVLNGVVAA